MAAKWVLSLGLSTFVTSAHGTPLLGGYLESHEGGVQAGTVDEIEDNSLMAGDPSAVEAEESSMNTWFVDEVEDVAMMASMPEFPQGSAVAPGGIVTDAQEVDVAAPDSEPRGDWQRRFAAGLERSEAAAAAKDDASAGPWEVDASGAGVPTRLRLAEDAMLEALQAAPDSKERRDKTAVYALRLYNHAKWLAERNHARASELRYWKANEVALLARRSVLAGHALSRLGYFLMNWGRHEEARRVLQESVQTSTKSNPLAPYLLGVLDRKAAAADADIERLRAADERILSAEKQPSEDLEEQREKLVGEIRFWQDAAGSPTICLDASDVAHVAICLVTHLACALRTGIA